MLKTTNPTELSSILQLLIDAADEKEVCGSDSNETNLLNSSLSKKSIGTDYLTFESAKKGGGNSKKGSGNTKKDVKAVKGSNYLILDAKKDLTTYDIRIKCSQPSANNIIRLIGGDTQHE